MDVVTFESTIINFEQFSEVDLLRAEVEFIQQQDMSYLKDCNPLVLLKVLFHLSYYSDNLPLRSIIYRFNEI